MDYNSLQTNNTVLYAFINQVLELRGTTWKELSKESNIPYDTMLKMRKGKQNTSTNRLYRIFEVIGVTHNDYGIYVQYMINSGIHRVIKTNQVN